MKLRIKLSKAGGEKLFKSIEEIDCCREEWQRACTAPYDLIIGIHMSAAYISRGGLVYDLRVFEGHAVLTIKCPDRWSFLRSPTALKVLPSKITDSKFIRVSGILGVITDVEEDNSELVNSPFAKDPWATLDDIADYLNTERVLLAEETVEQVLPFHGAKAVGPCSLSL
jgi:hypothetical protein